MSVASGTKAMIRIGTRGSHLARWQANWVAERLRELHAGLTVELVEIKTLGDRDQKLTAGRDRRHWPFHQGDSASPAGELGRSGRAQPERSADSAVG